MDWNRNGKRDPADDIIDRKLSEAGKKPAEPPSARPRAAHIRYSRRKIVKIFLRLTVSIRRRICYTEKKATCIGRTHPL